MANAEEYSPKQMLVEVNKAIQSVLLGGQSYKLGTRSVTRADLSLLRQMRDDLEAQLCRSDESPLMPDVVVAVFEGR